MKKKYIQAWDIETTGQRLQHKDVMFAIGSTTLCVELEESGKWISTTPVESQRWVLNINPGAAKEWDQLWKERGWEDRCWTEFWSKHVQILNQLMTTIPRHSLYNTEKEMMDNVASYLCTTEEKYGDDIVRVYDTIGFDVTEISNALERAGHPSIFLVRKGWPCNTSYLGDIRKAALCQNPLVNVSKEQRDARDLHDKSAVPEGISHNHDPAMDAACIAWKWVHYWKNGPWFTADPAMFLVHGHQSRLSECKK